MITSNQIRIEADDDMTLLQKYDKRLRSLILTPEGTMIGNRDFGIDFDLISMQPIQAANFLAMQLEQKITRYIPEINFRNFRLYAKASGSSQISRSVLSRTFPSLRTRRSPMCAPR